MDAENIQFDPIVVSALTENLLDAFPSTPVLINNNKYVFKRDVVKIQELDKTLFIYVIPFLSYTIGVTNLVRDEKRYLFNPYAFANNEEDYLRFKKMGFEVTKDIKELVHMVYFGQSFLLDNAKALCNDI